MSRKSRRSATGIQLFPFLAVLICTMGALIVLLVLMVQHTRVDAKTKAAALLAEQQQKSAQDEERIRREREAFEDEQWRAEMLAQQRTEIAQDLTDRRLKLSHLEDHIRRLREQAQQLIDRARQIDNGAANKDQDLAAARAELDALRKRIAEKQKELDEARKQKPKDQWFALIAYDGPNGTRRRPIYLECTGQGVILQPEGLLFNAEDFSGPLSAGNPLDSALRATREYLVKAGNQAYGEPYPLLVVRPSGIIAYGAARSAMKSWDQEFGYELVSEDKKLTFGSPDPALQQVLGQTVAVARQKQAVMMSAMPRHYEKGEALTSFAPQDQPEYRQAVASSGGRGFGGGGQRGVGLGFGGDTPVNALARGGSGGGRGGDMPVRGSAATSTSSLAMGGTGGGPNGGGGQGSGTGSGTGDGGPTAGGPASGGPAIGNPGGSGGSASGGSAGGGSAGGASSPGATSGMSGGMNSISMGNQAAAGAASSAGTPGQDSDTTGGNGSGRHSGQPGAGPPATGQAKSGASSVRGGTAQNGSPNRGSSSGSGGAGSGKGSNWGLPESRIHSTAVTRPIRVVVLRDRIIILPELGDDRAAQTIMISPQLTFAEVDRFVNAVQKHMKSWGLAVANGYWKPILRIEVAPDAEEVFADLQLGIEDSGFDVQRKVE